MDTQGNLLGVLVNAANEQDGMSLLKLLREGKEISSHLQIIYGDTTYNRKEVRSILEEKGNIQLHIVSTPRQRIWVHKDRVAEALEFLCSQPSFQIQPRRWVVERTFAWASRQRRLSKDYEYLLEVSEAYLYMDSLDYSKENSPNHCQNEVLKHPLKKKVNKKCLIIN